MSAGLVPRVGKPVRFVFAGHEYPGLISKVRSSMVVDIVFFDSLNLEPVRFAYNVDMASASASAAGAPRWEWP